MTLPDNEAAYGDQDDPSEEEAEPAALSDEALAWQFLLLVNPGDEETALRQFSHYREAQAEAGDAREPVALLADVVDWTSGFRVRGDDNEAFIDSINELARRWNLDIDWGGEATDEEFLEATDVPELMATAYDRLREYGYTLWTWDTGGEGHAGWITLSTDDEVMRLLAAAMEIELRPGSDAF